MSTLLYRVGRGAGRHPWRIVALWMVAAIAAIFLNSAVGGAPDETFRLPGAESQRGADLLEERFPEQSLFTSNVVFHDDRGLTDPAVRRAVELVIRDLAAGPHVMDVAGPFGPASTVSADGTTAFATIAYDQESTTDAMLASADAAVAPLRADGVEVAYDGSLGYATANGEGGTEIIGILIAVVVLAIVFGSTARGTDGPSSDVDVAVLGRGLDFLALARDLSRALGREAQVVDLDAVSYPMLQAIVRDGVVVAEHDRVCAARWRSRALVDLENDRPWFERMRDAYLGHLAAGHRA